MNPVTYPTNVPERPPLPLPFTGLTLSICGRRQLFWEVSSLGSEWKLLAGPFCPETFPTDENLLCRHLAQVENTWSVLARTGEDEYSIYRHADECDPFIHKSGAVFARPGYAPWLRPYAEYWAEVGNITVDLGD